MEEHDYEREIIAEILAFWEKIPNSHLQKLADNVEIPEAAKLWEKDALLFYQRFKSQLANSSFQVYWDDVTWRDYRSVCIESRDSGTFLPFEYPVKCFRLQGLNRAFYEELMKKWANEENKSLHRFIEAVLTRSRNILADLNSDELLLLKTAARSSNDLASQDFWTSNPSIYKYYLKKTGLSEDLAKIFYRLVGYGVLGTRTQINFAKIGLIPYLLITSRDLEKFEQDYCFFHVKSSKADIKFFGLAMPPIAATLGWQDNLSREMECFEIKSFSYGWNLSRLTITGWKRPPVSLLAAHSDKGFGQVILDFHTTPVELWSSDPLYLERTQGSSPRDTKGEIGKDGKQRLQELATLGIIHPIHSFRPIQLSNKLIVLFCRGSSENLVKIQKIAYHFPLFRILRGTDWVLLVLKMPPTWISSTIANLQDLTSQLPLTDLAIDIDQRFAAERFLQFSKLWDPEKKTWVVWEY